MNTGIHLDRDTWIVSGQIPTDQPPPGSGKQLQTSRYRGVVLSAIFIFIFYPLVDKKNHKQQRKLWPSCYSHVASCYSHVASCYSRTTCLQHRTRWG